MTNEKWVAFEQAIEDTWKDFTSVPRKADAGELTSTDAFGTRDQLKNNYMLKWAGAVLGIYGKTAGTRQGQGSKLVACPEGSPFLCRCVYTTQSPKC